MPGSVQVSLSDEELANLGTVTSILFVMYPNQLTALGAVTADGLLAISKLSEESGVIEGYNPFVGVSYVVPQNQEQAVASVIRSVPELAKSLGTMIGPDSLKSPQALADALKERKVSIDDVAKVLFPLGAVDLPSIELPKIPIPTPRTDVPSIPTPEETIDRIRKWRP